MAKQKVEIEVDVPDGWEVARFGQPRDGQYFISDGQAIKASMNFKTEKLILRRVKQYREPVLPADAGKTVECSDDLGEGAQWFHEKLVGWFASHGWLDAHRRYWKHCRIEKESTE